MIEASPAPPPFRLAVLQAHQSVYPVWEIGSGTLAQLFGRNRHYSIVVPDVHRQSLERICSFLHERIVSNDNVVQWEGRRFQIPPQRRRFSFAGAKVQLYQGLDGRVSLYYGDTRLEDTNTPGG